MDTTKIKLQAVALVQTTEREPRLSFYDERSVRGRQTVEMHFTHPWPLGNATNDRAGSFRSAARGKRACEREQSR